ncbi:MAG TPA: NINE protein [Mucilaginibacter sp.]|jgi:TM2 domain-containing membrane protein YozV
MEFNDDLFLNLPGVTPGELAAIVEGVAGLSRPQKKFFYMVYSENRKPAKNILIYCVLGLCPVPGLQRLIVGEILMGFLYFFTLGFFFIGSIADILNYRTIAADCNLKIMYECIELVKSESLWFKFPGRHMPDKSYHP